MPRIILQPKDISALSLIAQRPTKSRALVNGLSETARPIGLALTGRALPPNGGRKSKSAIETARYLHKWGGAKGELRVVAPDGYTVTYQNGDVVIGKLKTKGPAKKKVARKANRRRRA
jgi:hypothetical protein